MLSRSRRNRLLDLDVSLLVQGLTAGHNFVALDLSYNRLGMSAAEALAKLLATDSAIEVIDLSESDLDESAVVVVCTALRDNVKLRELRLSGNRLGKKGGMCVAELLQISSSLRRLYLANCDLDTESLVAISTAMRSNELLEVLNLQRPMQLSLHEEVASHCGRMLEINSSLVDLDLSKACMRDRGLKLLSVGLIRAGAAAGLRTLRLQSNELELGDEDCVNALGELLASPVCPLVILDLGCNKLRDNGALVLSEMVSSNASLRMLNLSSNGIGSRGLCALGPALAEHSTLKEASVWGNRFDSAACRSWLGALDSLALDMSVQQVDGTFHAVQA